MPTISTAAHRPRLQARLRAVAGERCGPDEPADRVALRERAGVTRPRQARPGDCRPLLRQLRHTPRDGRARHRRHGRRRAWPSAAIALQRPLRRALLSADPRLRHRHRSSGGHDPAARQDALRRRGPWPCPPSRPGDPPPLVDDPIRVGREIEDKDAGGGFAETPHAAKSWTRERRVAARIEATRLGLDIRYVVTNTTGGTAEWLYADLYCARGQAENLIKLHKTQLASDRTSCRSARANQVRLVFHTAAYWLLLAVRDAIPKAHALGKAEFTTIRLRLLKVAARVTETVSRVRLAFAAACPEADLFRRIAITLQPAGP